MILNFNKQSLNENAFVKYIQDTKTLLKIDCFRKVPNFIFQIKFRSFYSAAPIMTALPVHKRQAFINRVTVLKNYLFHEK